MYRYLYTHIHKSKYILYIYRYKCIYLYYFSPLFTRECRRSLPSAHVVQHLSKIRLPLLLTTVMCTEVVFTNYVCFFVSFRFHEQN